MTASRRKEPFRYSMNPPLDCRIEIIDIDGISFSGKSAQAELIDISKSGCRIRTELDLHITSHVIRAAVHVSFGEDNFIFPGVIRWQEELEPSQFHYGFQLELSPEEKEKLNVELRKLAASRRIVVY